jgi:LEA14-like dessication related protein
MSISDLISISDFWFLISVFRFLWLSPCTSLRVMRRDVAGVTLLTTLCIALAAVSLIFSGCSTIARGLHIVNPTYSIRDIRPRVDIAIPLAASSIDFDFMLGVDNPNSVGLRLDRFDFKVLINDNPVAEGFTNDRIEVPAHGYGNVPVRVRVGYSNIRNIFREVADLVHGNGARYEVRGRAYYSTPIGELQFPVKVFRRGSER